MATIAARFSMLLSLNLSASYVSLQFNVIELSDFILSLDIVGVLVLSVTTPIHCK